MADEILQILLEIAVDEAAARQAKQRIDELDKATKSATQSAEAATRQLRQLAERGEKLRNVGAVMAGLGAAISGPMLLATNQYLERYKGLEATANRYNQALQRQQDATTRVGRQITSVFTPAMQGVADLLEKVADLAERNPELVKIAAVAGIGLAGGGASLIAAGTAISSIARAAELLKGTGAGGLASGALKAGVLLAAVAAASEGTILGLNELGKATGDQRLATIGMSDIFKTGRQLIGAAILELLKELLKFKLGFETLTDIMATGFRDLFSRISEALANFKNGLLDAVAGLLKMAGLEKQAQDVLAQKDYTVGGKFGNATLENMYATDRDKNQAGFQDRNKARVDQYNTDVANLGAVAASIGGWVDTGQFGVGGAASPAAKGAGVGGTAGPSELAQAFMERQKAILASEKQFNADLKTLNKQRETDDKKARADLKVAQDAIDKEQSRADQDADRKAATEERKAKVDFEEQTRQIVKDRQRQAEADLKAHNARMAGFEANRDAAGYIQEQEAWKDQQDATAKQQQDEDDKRRTEFEKASRERQDALREEKDQNRRAADDKRRDLADSFRREQDQRAEAYRTALDQLNQKHRDEKSAIDTAFAEQVAQLSGNFAGLNSMYQMYYADMNKQALAFVNTQAAYLRSLYASGTGGGATYGYPDLSKPPVSHGAFAPGTDYVPKTGKYQLEEGEVVLGLRDSMAYRRGKGGPNITIQITTADVASKADIQTATDQIVRAVQGTLEQAGVL